MSTVTPRDEQAADWFLRLSAPTVEADEIEAGLAWIDASADNRAAFERVERFWHAAGGGAAEQPRPVAAPAPSPRRAVLGRIAAALLVAVALAGGIAALWAPAPGPARYATMVGETRTIELPDGSQITLGGASSVAVEYSRHARRVVLSDGEALFRVEKNPRRPFIVEAGGGFAQVLGTVFNVHRGPEGITVGVAEGSVQVQADSNPGARSVRLQVGSEVTYSTQAGLGPTRHVDPRRVTAWPQGVLTFIDRPLASVVVDLNRYSPRLITIEDEAIKRLHVTGSVSVDGIVEWLQALQSVAAVELNEAGGRIALQRTTAGKRG